MEAPEDGYEFDLSEQPVEEPVDWESIDLDEPEPPIAPWVSAKTAWGEIDLAALVKQDLTEPGPELLRRQDGPCLLYRGKVHSIAGEPESGKSWFALHAVAQCIADGHHAVYIDFEDTPKSVIGRLIALGVPKDIIAEKVHYIRPEQPLVWKITALGKQTTQTWFDLLSVLKRAQQAEGGLRLIVFDGMTEALGLQGILGKDNEDVAAWFGEVPRRLAHAVKAAVLLIDHVTKDTDTRGRYAIGAQAKLAALDGCQFLAKMQMQFAQGRSGSVRISVSKDRPGHVRASAVATKATAVIADLIITALPEPGTLRLTLVAPDIETTDDGSVKPTQVQKTVQHIMSRRPDGISKTDLKARIKARAQVKNEAIEDMIDNGWLVEFKNGSQKMVRRGLPKDER